MRIQMYQTERWAEQSWPSLNDWSFGTRNSSNDKLSAMAETAAANELPSTHFTVSHTQNANYYVITFSISAVLRHCWLGVRKSVRSVKKLSDEVLVWLYVWSEVQTVFIWSSWCHCFPKSHLLPHLNPGWLYLSDIGLLRLSWKRQ